MTSIKKATINGKEVMFLNHFIDTRNGFTHKTEMYINGFPVREARRNYLNRTWERYRYQSVMLDAIQTEMDCLCYDIAEDWKKKNGFKTMTAKRKEQFAEVLNRNQYYKELSAIYAEVKNGNKFEN